MASLTDETQILSGELEEVEMRPAAESDTAIDLKLQLKQKSQFNMSNYCLKLLTQGLTGKSSSSSNDENTPVKTHHIFPLQHGVNKIGRSESSHICILDKSVSKSHACIELEEADEGKVNVYIWDVESQNKTKLNGENLAPNQRTQASMSDQIQLGSVRFSLTEMSADEKSEQEKDRCHLVIGDGLDVDSSSNGVANGNGHHVNGKSNGVKMNSLFEIQNTLEETSGENGSENTHRNGKDLNSLYFKMCSEDTDPEDETNGEEQNDVSLNDSNNLSMSLRLEMTVNQSTMSGRVPKTPTTLVITETMVVDDEATREEYEEEEDLPPASTDEAPKAEEAVAASTEASAVPETVAVISDTVPVESEETQPIEITKEPETQTPANLIEDQTETLTIPDSLPATTTTTTTNESTEIKMDQQDPDIIPETQRIEDTQPVESSLIENTQDLVTSSAVTISSEANTETESKAETITQTEEKIETTPEKSSSKSTVVAAKKEEESIIMSDEEMEQVKMAPPPLPPIKQSIVVARKLTQQEIIVESTVLDTSIVDPTSQPKSEVSDEQPIEEKQPAKRGRPSKKINSSQSSDDAPKRTSRKSRAAEEPIEPAAKEENEPVTESKLEKSPFVEIIDSEMVEAVEEQKEQEVEKKVEEETKKIEEVAPASRPGRSRANLRATSTDEPIGKQESNTTAETTTAKASRGRRKTIQVATKDVEEAEKQVSEETKNSESVVEAAADLPPVAPTTSRGRGRGRPPAAATVASTSVNEEDDQQIEKQQPAPLRGRRGSANKEADIGEQPAEKAPALTRRSSLRTRNPPAAPVVVAPKSKKVAEEIDEPSKDLDESELMPAPPVPVEKPAASTLKRKGTLRGKKEKETTVEENVEEPPPPPPTPVSVTEEDVTAKPEVEKKGRRGAKTAEPVEESVEDKVEEENQPKKAAVGRRKSFANAKKEEQTEATTEAKSRLRDRRKTVEVSAVAVAAAANAKAEVTKAAPKRGAKNQSLSEVKEEETEEPVSTKKAPRKRKSAIAEAVQRAAESAYEIEDDEENEEEAEAETSVAGKRKRKSIEPKETKSARGKRKSKSTEEDADGNTSNNESTNTPKLFFQSKQRLEANVSKSASASSTKPRYSNLITTPKRQSLAPSTLAVNITPGSNKKFKLNKSGNMSNYSFSEEEEEKVEAEKPKEEVASATGSKKSSPAKSPPKRATILSSETTKVTSASVSRRKSVRFGKGTNSAPIIMTTGLVLDEKHQQMIKNLGGETTTNVKECTHLITNKVRKTFKFLCCVSRSVHILSDRWLDESNRQKTFLNPAGFELQDPQSEKQLKFSLQTSLLKAKSSELLHGWKFLLKYEPKPEDELSVNDVKMIIECAGGEVVEKLPSRKDHRSKCCILYTDLNEYETHKSEDEDVMKTLCDSLCDSILRQSFEPKLELESNDA